MRKFLSTIFLAALTLGIGACGGDDDAFQTPGPGGSGTVDHITVTSDSATIPSDNSAPATITATVLDANNNAVVGETVTFASDSGAIAVTQATTDDAGVATATLSTPGDATVRAIEVSATVGEVSGTATVNVVAPPEPPVPTEITLIASTPTIPSDGALAAEITAIARDSNNQFMDGVEITFSATSGGLTVDQGTTDENGVAKATLTSANDPTNRTITVTATAGTLSSTITVDVTGTALTVQGPSALTIDQTATYTITLSDAGGNGIAGRQVTITSENDNTLSAATVTTNSSGQATVDLTIDNTGSDILTAAALGLSTPRTIAVNNDSFEFTAPAADIEVPINTNRVLTLEWLSAGAPQVGQTVTFSTTRGVFTGNTPVTTDDTDGSGIATVTLSSTNAGFATITATAAGGLTATLRVEFIATVPDSVEVQASEFTIAPGEDATITAVVRDTIGNLVKNQTVIFTLDDTSGGTLSTGSAVTDSAGRAQTVYTAGSTTTAQDGVTVTATVQGVDDDVKLTVARRELFISIGTGNSIEEPNSAQYKVDYIVQVTDANGNGVAGVPLSVSMLSERYLKGQRIAGAESWITCFTTVVPGQTPTDPDDIVNTCNPDPGNGKALPAPPGGGGCADEDTNRNGVLDTNPVEDLNGSGEIEAGNIATASPSNITSDANGFALVSVYYPQEYAYWLWVTIEARASVQGTEFAQRQLFLLKGSAEDFNDVSSAPPGVNSPFGKSQNCSDTD